MGDAQIGGPGGGLRAVLESELPLRLTVGGGTGLFLHGWCYHPERAVRTLSVALDGVERPVIARGMPRADVYDASPWALDPEGRSYRSGFWAVLPIPECRGGPAAVQVRLVARLAGEGTVERSVGEMVLAPGGDSEDRGTADGAARANDAAPAPSPTRPRIAICMATHNPPAELFRDQVESIRAQTYPDWVCVVSDDASRQQRWAQTEVAIGDDPRFVVHRHADRVGHYRNFERALRAVPPDAELIAFCDQDDRWHPDKLAALEEALDDDATLAYADMRVVDAGGRVIADTYWTQRDTNHTDLAALVMVNTITGAASLFRRLLLADALPFPAPGQDSFHDHWIAMVALARGEIRYVDRPLHDYVQHGGAVLGHATANPPGGAGPGAQPTPGGRAGLMLALGDRLERWHDAYPHLARVLVSSRTLWLRCGDAAPRPKRRALRRLLRLERSFAPLPWLAWRRLRARGPRSPTLGKERQLIRAVLWPPALRLRARFRRRPRRDDRQSAIFPPGLEQVDDPIQVRRLARLIRPLNLELDSATPRRVNVLIPKIDLGHFFAGYIAKLNLARRLAEEGHRVRVVCVDDPGDLPPDWRQQVSRYAGLGSLLDDVEIEFAHDRRVPLAVGPDDRFVATTWWTAHLARGAVEEVGGAPFVYLIQECEHLTFAMGSFSAAAFETYGFPHFAVFSTELLRDYFRAHRLGVFAAEGAGERDCVSFRNAITRVTPPAPDDAARGEGRLLYYARPEEHAHRNMFELGLLGLAAARGNGDLDGWELYGVGAQRPDRVRWGDDLSLEILPRQGQAEYAELLRSHAVGMALMFTPHPSLVPLEMASAGMLVVTNTFENKTADALREISGNLIAVEPTIEGIGRGLAEAVSAAGDPERRLRGAEVRWPRSWDEAFDATVMARIGEFLS